MHSTYFLYWAVYSLCSTSTWNLPSRRKWTDIGWESENYSRKTRILFAARIQSLFNLMIVGGKHAKEISFCSTFDLFIRDSRIFYYSGLPNNNNNNLRDRSSFFFLLSKSEQIRTPLSARLNGCTFFNFVFKFQSISTL